MTFTNSKMDFLLDSAGTFSSFNKKIFNEFSDMAQNIESFSKGPDASVKFYDALSKIDAGLQENASSDQIA